MLANWAASELVAIARGSNPQRHQHGAEGARRRLEERPGTAEQRGQGEDRPQPAPECRHGGQRRRDQDLGQVAEGEDAPAVVTVGSLTGDESEGEQREELGQADHPDGESGLRDGHGPSSDLIHLPRDDDRLRTRGKGAEEPPARNSTYGGRDKSDDESSVASGG